MRSHVSWDNLCIILSQTNKHFLNDKKIKTLANVIEKKIEYIILIKTILIYLFNELIVLH